MIKRILYLINLAFALALLLFYITPFLPPHSFAELSLIPFLYPILLIVNVLFIIFWIFTKWTYAIIPLAIILIRMDYVPRLYQFDFNREEKTEKQSDIKVMNYNVCAFSYKTNKSHTRNDRMQDVLELIREEDPSIICFQDYISSLSDRQSIHYTLVRELGFKYYYCPNKTKNTVSRNIIYSKYPIAQSGVLFPTKKNSRAYIYADLELENGQKMRVYNYHLASFKLQKEDSKVFSELKEGEIDADTQIKFTTIAKKLIAANIKRSKEIEEITPCLEETHIPTMILGDFNDIPFSYTYKKITENFSDSFVGNGRGIGTTYNGEFPAYRIDYIFYKEEDFEVINYTRHEVEYSDHYPIVASLRLK